MRDCVSAFEEIGYEESWCLDVRTKVNASNGPAGLVHSNASNTWSSTTCRRQYQVVVKTVIRVPPDERLGARQPAASRLSRAESVCHRAEGRFFQQAKQFDRKRIRSRAKHVQSGRGLRCFDPSNQVSTHEFGGLMRRTARR